MDIKKDEVNAQFYKETDKEAVIYRHPNKEK